MNEFADDDVMVTSYGAKYCTAPANDPVYEALLIQVAREAKHQQKSGRLLVV